MLSLTYVVPNLSTRIINNSNGSEGHARVKRFDLVGFT